MLNFPKRPRCSHSLTINNNTRESQVKIKLLKREVTCKAQSTSLPILDAQLPIEKHFFSAYPWIFSAYFLCSLNTPLAMGLILKGARQLAMPEDTDKWLFYVGLSSRNLYVLVSTATFSSTIPSNSSRFSKLFSGFGRIFASLWKFRFYCWSLICLGNINTR